MVFSIVAMDRFFAAVQPLEDETLLGADSSGHGAGGAAGGAASSRRQKERKEHYGAALPINDGAREKVPLIPNNGV